MSFMKLFYILAFVCTSVLSFSQGDRTEKIKITKSQFSKAKTLQELLPSIPKECAVSEYQFAIDTPESKRNIKMKSNEIISDIKSIVKEMKGGQKIFIENIKSDCKTEFKKNYILVII
jgi:hypothetical protein